MKIRFQRQEPRDGGLAASGRPPQHHRGDAPVGDHSPDRPVGAEKMILAQHLVEPRRAQPIGERPGRVRLEQPAPREEREHER